MSRIYRSDEELGKRDDNYRPAREPTSRNSNIVPARWRRKRFLSLIVGVVLLYLFVKNIPTDLGSIDQRMGRPLRPDHVGRIDMAKPRGMLRPATQPISTPGQEPVGPPARPPPSDGVSSASAGEGQHYYSGPVRYYKLSSSLSQVIRIQGRARNTHVLFIAADLRCVSNILPLACEMGRQEKNHVHFLIVSRDDMSLDDILAANSISRDSCGKLHLHDGRPDRAAYSTDARAQSAVYGALGHAERYLHSPVFITDDADLEETFLLKAISKMADKLEKTVIRIPKDKYDDFTWLTRLDTASLAAWHKPDVNILIQVQPESAGGLTRLLESLKEADHVGFTPPRLMIELPSNVNTFLKSYLDDFSWPPKVSTNSPKSNLLSIHHRIASPAMHSEISGIRFIESYFPANAEHSYALVLSTQAELSPLYYHYLMYEILYTRYSAALSTDGDMLLGIALNTPPTLPNKEAIETSNATSYLWQSPSSDAMLFFPKRWMELHAYLAHRVDAFHATKDPKRIPKQVSATKPAWLEYMVELMRARAWSVLHPISTKGGPWVTVHDELYRVPEEYKKRPKPKTEKETKSDASTVNDAKDDNEPFLTPTDVEKPEKHESLRQLRKGQPLHLLLPNNQDDSDGLTALPYLDPKGKVTHWAAARRAAREYIVQLRESIGGCPAEEAPSIPYDVPEGSADDIFCVKKNTEKN